MNHLLAVTMILGLVPGLLPAAQAVEIAPFIGQRFGGSFEDGATLSRLDVADTTSRGLQLDFDTEPNKQIEVFLSRQNTSLTAAGTFTGNPLFNLTIDYYHIGGLYILPESDILQPFVSGSLGLTRMTPEGAGLSAEDRFSLSLGGGTKVFLTRYLGLRFDARAIYTALNADTAIFCSGGCNIKVVSNGFVQGEVGMALLLKF
jgi:hypothetical protein